MTEHSIEELKRQLDAATSKVTEAQKSLNEAKARLNEARLNETGLRGHKVSYHATSWRDRVGTEVFFVVESLSRWGHDLEGRMVKKDGTLGSVKKQAYPTSLTDHGPYSEPTP